ncbi:MAG: DUF4349 domain-containing protein [Zoogloeaceae bacterium]|nr:DUF4349 domain-containing protein [Zoogloeaceae bacterium]
MSAWKKLARIALPATLTLLAACSQQHEYGSAPASETSAPAAMLAYEHSVDIELPAEQIPQRLSAAREACATAKFGECHILNINQDQYRSGLTVRVLPAGVEPLIALAGEAGNITSRHTRAEDLSQAVTDNRQKQAQLAAYAKRMDELSRRPDITVADLITLAHEQASVQQQRETLLQESTQQQRRIDTNLLTLNFSDADSDSVWRDFSQSLGKLLENLLEGTANALTVLAYSLPFLLLLFPLLLLWRFAWRRIVGRKTKTAP